MKANLSLALLLALAAPAASAACYAEYQARRDDPYGLHYGVAQIAGPCNVAQAEAELWPRLSNNGWTLLSVQSVFDESGLQERQANAGEYFLRY